ncbi:terminase small subunit [Desulfosporosinus hippei]|uniref:Phage terminase small subunit n=1 Tax=Desulfosporosinus hippei DSM 8344 TaxID=1121419 RepID=A0A1G7UJZ6_9FIRM|nr:terminase small subunit [Desulfosporosinus hippei]SDG47854.1 phage terminase small subunit [Desulfosporosinus hippei DSM 8344]
MAKLTAKQKKFITEYLIDLNATQAAIRAGYSPKTSYSIGQENLKKPEIQNAIQKAKEKRAERTEITADMVLQRWWDIATADPNEIIHLRRVCCRHCFGIDHQYQWRDEEEYQQAVRMAYDLAREQNKEPAIPSNAGGYGFDRLLRPHPKCPYCRGEGNADLHIEDTRHLSAKAKLLFAGIKQTQAGVEIKMRDQDKALENVARHIGMFTEKIDINGSMVIFKGENELED